MQSIVPGSQEFDDSREDISNDKINRYNELVVEIAEEQKVHYLDVASAFKDEKGCLPELADKVKPKMTVTLRRVFVIDSLMTIRFQVEVLGKGDL